MSIDRFSRWLFVFSAIFLVLICFFSWGLATGKGKTWPSDQFYILEGHLKSLVQTGHWAQSGLYVVAPRTAERETFVVHNAAKHVDGYRVFMGWDSDLSTYAAWLYDAQGQQLHRWPINYRALFASDGQGRRSREPLTQINPHGMAILPDGSVLANFGSGGEHLVRLDACGELIWAKYGAYHHSIFLDDSGRAWTWLAPHPLDRQHQILVSLNSETGETVFKQSMPELIAQSSDAALILAGVGIDYPFNDYSESPESLGRGRPDLFHPNDVEVLSTKLVDMFPQFQAGDLLISLRNRNLIAVLDASARKIKWWRQGPWVRQHDPDFADDGRIYVYNNNPAGGRSSIVAIDPQTDHVEQHYSTGPFRFFSRTQGKLQLLPDGLIQLVIPSEGRVVEADLAGDIVFEFNNITDKNVNGRVLNAAWLPVDYFSRNPSCVQGDTP